MNRELLRWISLGPLAVGVLSPAATRAESTQAPAPASAPAQQKQSDERDRLVKQIGELRQAGRFDESVSLAERALELERKAGGKTTAGLAEALTRLAELHELRGDWPKALASRKQALAVRERVDGNDQWRTTDARLALTLAERVAALGEKDRAKIARALRKEDEAAQREGQRRYAEAEQVALEALTTYLALIGREALEVARIWHRIGRVRLASNDARGAREANELALAIRRTVLPVNHPDLGRSLNNLGLAEQGLGNTRGALVALEQAVRIWRTALGPDDPLVVMGLTSLGRVQYALGEFPAAKASIEQALAIYRKARPPSLTDIADCLNRLGNLQLKLREYVAAQASYTESLAIRREVLPAAHPDIALILYCLEAVHYRLGNYPAAKASIEQALAIYRKVEPRSDTDIADCLNRLGSLQRQLRDYAGAKASHEEALAIRRKVLQKEDSDLATSLTNLGNVQDDLRDWRGAKKSFEEAVAIRRKALPRDYLDTAHTLYNLENVHYELGEYTAAKATIEESLAIYRKARPPRFADIADCLNRLANVQEKLHDFVAAKESREKALAARRYALEADRRDLARDHPDIARDLNSLGHAQWRLRQYAAARQSFEEVLRIYRSVHPADHPDIAVTLYSLGCLRYAMGEYTAAKATIELALASYSSARPPRQTDIADCLSVLGKVHETNRDFVGARSLHAEALAIRRKALPPGHPDIAWSLAALGMIQWNLEDSTSAKASHLEALTIRRRVLPKEDPEIARSLDYLGLAQHALGELAAAKASHEEALAIRRVALPANDPDIAWSLNNVGVVERDLGEFAAAKASQEEALSIRRKALPSDHPDIAYSLWNLGWLSLLSGVDVKEAVARLAEATDIFHAEQLRLAVAQAEQEQFTTRVRVEWCLERLIDATLAAHADPVTAYDRLLRVKESVTAQQRWARQARDSADNETTRLLDRYCQVTRRIVALSMSGRPVERSSNARENTPDYGYLTDLFSLSGERHQIEEQLTERSATYRTILARAKVDSSAVRAALPEHTALIDVIDYYHVGPAPKGDARTPNEQRLAAFVIPPDRHKIALVPLGPTQGLASLIERWRTSHGAGKVPPAGTSDPGTELRQKLWEPLAQHLDGVALVSVSPDGPLNGLPSAALPGSKPGTFLIREYAFAIVPVPQLLPELLQTPTQRAKVSPTLLLAGAIDFGNAKPRDPKSSTTNLPALPFFKPLAGTESEVNDLEARFRRAFPQSAAPRVLTEGEATKEAVLAAAPANRFVHLATHGFFAEESEESAVDVAQRADLLKDGLRMRPEAGLWHPGVLSGLVFAGVKRSDRRPEETILTALEAAELELGQVDLLALSACQTGRGRVAGGEGVLRLQRAFQLAGARSVVASLWKVPDEETHQLMREFYRRVWSKDPISKAQALRDAQLWMLENWKPRGTLTRPAPEGPPPPYYWAAFVLSGDWR
jgi:CHAT domain-containing protein